MSFTTPAALLLLLALPFLVWLVRPARGWQGARPRSGWPGLILRLLIAGLIILSLAGAQLVRAVDNLAVVFLVDASDSMSVESAAAAEQYVREAVAAMPPNDRAAVILFGGNALVEQPLRLFESAGDLPAFASRPLRLQTDLAGAIRLGLALLPPDAARRLVVLSDGAATTGDTTEAARLAAAAGVAIDTVYLPRPAASGEVILTGVHAPARVGQGETFRLELSATSEVATEATLRVIGEGAVVHEEIVRLQPGANQLVVRLLAGEPAFARYRVQLEPLGPADAYPQNNELAAFTEITGPPRVLVVAAAADTQSDPPAVDDAAQLADALVASGLAVARATPAILSASLADLADYAAVVLVNVNARDLSPRKMEALEAYTRDLGGGLVAVGGPSSFGVGGYFETPLEAALPVDMRIEDQQRFPAVSMALVIDRSGSMAAIEGGVAKIQLAAEGAIRALELLNDFDEMTIIPVDEAPDEIIGPITAANREEAIDHMRRLGAGGGGIFVRNGLEAAAGILAVSDNEVRHIILLADGADSEQKEGVPALIEQLAAEGITVSTVSIGAGLDTVWLQEMAELGRGRFHFTDQAANLPQIFTQETVAIQRNYVVEERFFPTQTAPSPILTGITATPPLYGYVAASAKDTATVALQTPLGDPLLAQWQYGLGRSVAWTSDATGRWAREWVPWDGFAPFWNQAVRWTFGGRAAGGLDATITLDGETARLSVDAQRDGEFLNGLALAANVVAPDGATQTIPLRQVGPGQYEGAFTPTGEGAYFVGVGTTDDETSGSGRPSAVGGLKTTAGWVLGYSPEYAALDGNPDLLAALAAQTGGRVLVPADVAAAFEHNLAAAPAAQPIWPWLTLAAVLLLPLDVAARRLTLTRRDWARLWARVTSYERRATSEEKVAEPERAEGMAQLLQAKERAGVQGSRGAGEMPATDARPQTSGLPSADDRPLRGDDRPATTDPPQPTTDQPPSDDTLAARLRQRRKL